ncbi:MAG TPA: hypothetical protein VGW34_07235 [Allosphingosinicella sp.]|nr:hypothetical protein [Allosphingosinicella sp.]
MKAWAVAVLLLAGCHSHSELTASEAIEAANAELTKALPQMKHHGGDVKAERRDDTWRVEIGGGCGGVTIDVDSRTGKATIIEIQQ